MRSIRHPMGSPFGGRHRSSGGGLCHAIRKRSDHLGADDDHGTCKRGAYDNHCAFDDSDE